MTIHFSTTVKVRFAETDANGHMSHVSAVIYMEQARTEFLEALGLFDMDKIAAEGKTFVLASQKIDYRRQAYFNDRLAIGCTISRIGSSSLDIDYAIQNEATGDLLMTGTSTVVYFDHHAQKSTPLPSDLQARIEEVQKRFV